MNPDVRATIMDVLIKVTIALIAGAFFARAMPRAPAAWRHWVWMLSIVAALMMPGLCAVMPAWRVLPVWRDHQADPQNGVIVEVNPLFPPGEVAADDSVAQKPQADSTPPVPSAAGIARVGPLHQRISLVFGLIIVWTSVAGLLLGRVVISWLV